MWYFEYVKDGQFGKWLQGVCDWLIFWNCYWGILILVWKFDDLVYLCIDVYGSFDELECDFGVCLVNLYWFYIDEFICFNLDDLIGCSMM